ncbi:unnamed protein product, partial [Callosobruchus maculatus]
VRPGPANSKPPSAAPRRARPRHTALKPATHAPKPVFSSASKSKTKKKLVSLPATPTDVGHSSNKHSLISKMPRSKAPRSGRRPA